MREERDEGNSVGREGPLTYKPGNPERETRARKAQSKQVFQCHHGGCFISIVYYQFATLGACEQNINVD